MIINKFRLNRSKKIEDLNNELIRYLDKYYFSKMNFSLQKRKKLADKPTEQKKYY